MFPFSNKIKRTGVEIHYIISGVEMPVETKISASKETDAFLASLELNPFSACREVQRKYSLESLPDVKVEYLSKAKYIEEFEANILAKIIFTGQDIPKRKGFSWFSKLLMFLTFLSIVGAGVSLGVLSSQPELPECAIIFVEDLPLKIRINSSEYPLDPDGTMSMDTKVHMNPWHRQVLDSGKCVKQNIQSKE